MNVAVLVLNDVFDAGLSLLIDTLETANAMAKAPSARTIVRMVGLRRRVRTHQGLLVPTTLMSPRGRPDIVLVPAMGAKTPDALEVALQRPEARDAQAQLAAWSRAGSRVLAACTSTFLVAEAGLLDGQRATTTWWLAAAFRARYPQVKLDDTRMVVETKHVVTAGASLAHLDLALWLVRQRSPSLAREVGHYFLFDHRPSQSSFVMPDHVAHNDDLVERFEAWARRHLVGFSMSDAARAIGASERTVERRVQATLGRTPLQFVQDLRVAQAMHRMATTDATIDQIAEEVGYADGFALRQLLRKRTGRGVRELRQAARS